MSKLGKGFTLVEVVAAMSLTAILFAGLLAMAAGMRRTIRTPLDSDETKRLSFLTTLRSDLSSASFYKLSNGFRLDDTDKSVAIDATKSKSIVWQTLGVGEKFWLVREVRVRDGQRQVRIMSTKVRDLKVAPIVTSPGCYRLMIIRATGESSEMSLVCR
jgi:prepilin-type N-terminal cleavage/methylation domain-containing protein